MYSPDHPLFKTHLCRHWLNGTCARGNACNFAHGTEQLRQHHAPTCTTISWEPRSPILLHSEQAIVDGGRECVPELILQGGNSIEDRDFICIDIKEQRREGYEQTQEETQSKRECRAVWGSHFETIEPAGYREDWSRAAELVASPRADNRKICARFTATESSALQTTSHW